MVQQANRSGRYTPLKRGSVDLTPYTRVSEDSQLTWLEKGGQKGGATTHEQIADALDEYSRLFKAGIASNAEKLTLARAYPDTPAYVNAVSDVDPDTVMVVGGPASVEMVDREGHLITTDALSKAFDKYMENFRTRNAMVLHSDVQVGWALPAYITKGGQIFKSGINGKELFFITELRDDTKIADRVSKQIDDGKLRSYSIAGSATKVQNMQKGLMPYMQVDDMELAEVTVCEKGVNQGASFQILKAQTGKISKEQCGYRPATDVEMQNGIMCSTCKFFSKDDKTCDTVDGLFEDTDYCKLFDQHDEEEHGTGPAKIKVKLILSEDGKNIDFNRSLQDLVKNPEWSTTMNGMQTQRDWWDWDLPELKKAESWDGNLIDRIRANSPKFRNMSDERIQNLLDAEPSLARILSKPPMTDEEKQHAFDTNPSLRGIKERSDARRESLRYGEVGDEKVKPSPEVLRANTEMSMRRHLRGGAERNPEVPSLAEKFNVQDVNPEAPDAANELTRRVNTEMASRKAGPPSDPSGREDQGIFLRNFLKAMNELDYSQPSTKKTVPSKRGRSVAGLQGDANPTMGNPEMELMEKGWGPFQSEEEKSQKLMENIARFRQENPEKWEGVDMGAIREEILQNLKQQADEKGVILPDHMQPQGDMSMANDEMKKLLKGFEALMKHGDGTTASSRRTSGGSAEAMNRSQRTFAGPESSDEGDSFTRRSAIADRGRSTVSDLDAAAMAAPSSSRGGIHRGGSSGGNNRSGYTPTPGGGPNQEPLGGFQGSAANAISTGAKDSQGSNILRWGSGADQTTNTANLKDTLGRANPESIEAARNMAQQYKNFGTPVQGSQEDKTFRANNPNYNWNADPNNPNRNVFNMVKGEDDMDNEIEKIAPIGAAMRGAAGFADRMRQGGQARGARRAGTPPNNEVGGANRAAGSAGRTAGRIGRKAGSALSAARDAIGSLGRAATTGMTPPGRAAGRAVGRGMEALGGAASAAGPALGAKGLAAGIAGRGMQRLGRGIQERNQPRTGRGMMRSAPRELMPQRGRGFDRSAPMPNYREGGYAPRMRGESRIPRMMRSARMPEAGMGSGAASRIGRMARTAGTRAMQKPRSPIGGAINRIRENIPTTPKMQIDGVRGARRADPRPRQYGLGLMEKSLEELVAENVIKAEGFTTLANEEARQQEHGQLLREYGFPSEMEPEAGRYVPVIETETNDKGIPINNKGPWVVNEAGQDAGGINDEDAPNYSASEKAKNTAGEHNKPLKKSWNTRITPPIVPFLTKRSL